MQPLLFERMSQSTDDVLLPHQRFKAFGTIFSGEDLIRHSEILPYSESGKVLSSMEFANIPSPKPLTAWKTPDTSTFPETTLTSGKARRTQQREPPQVIYRNKRQNPN